MREETILDRRRSRTHARFSLRLLPLERQPSCQTPSFRSARNGARINFTQDFQFSGRVMSTRFSLRGAILCSLLTFVAGTTVGLLIGYYLSTRVADPPHVRQVHLLRNIVRDGWSDEPNVTQRILDGIDSERIRENLRVLSSEYHVAGTERDKELAQLIRDSWLESGLHSADLIPYDVLLSFPNQKKPNMVQVIGGHGKILFTSSTEVPLLPEDEKQNIVQGYHAYSPSGTVEGQLVYVSHGFSEDIYVLNEYNVTLKGKIALVREGGGQTGAKIRSLYEHGAVGVISFPDPHDVAKDGNSNVYPHSSWLPGTGVVRSSAAFGVGDPLTPGFPSIESAYRLTIDKVELPPIPSQPIGYEDARKLMSWLGGKTIDSEFWDGPFDSIYRIGPGFADKSHKKVRLTVNNEYKTVTVYNVIGIIEGDIEPDRYVILGNHRDAWGFGAIDPSSGTAMMMELIRVLGQLTREGWKPRRTLVFCSWAAEEFGLIGSTEWVEHKFPKLQSRAVAYINTDICVMGDTLDIKASPILTDAIYQITKLIPDPEGKARSLYDAWLQQFEALYEDEEDPDEPQEPHISPVAPISDFAPFIYTAGIPVMDVTFKLPLANETNTPYPMYHTGYETFHLVDKIVDPNFKRHRTCGQVAGLAMRYLADSSILPFSLQRLSDHLVDILLELNDTVSDATFSEAVRNFTYATDAWYERFSKIDRQNPLMVRMFNDQMMIIERSLTTLPLRDVTNTFTRHRLYSAIPTLQELLNQPWADDEILEKFQEEAKSHLADLTVAIVQAAELMHKFSSI